MPSQKSFGRRATAQNVTALPRPAAPIFGPVPEIRPVEAVSVPSKISAPPEERSIDVDRELEEWKETRKIHKRSFREPWRTLTIAATVGFGLSSWLLPDSVADVAQLVTGGLGAASLFAGLRGRVPMRKFSSEIGD